MADAAVWITGTGPDKKLNFRLPTGGKGDKGDKGDKGADGSNVLPTDTAIKQAIENTGSATRGALNATFATKTDLASAGSIYKVIGKLTGDAAPAINAAIAEVTAGGGGTVALSPGHVYDVANTVLVSGSRVTLDLNGATIRPTSHTGITPIDLGDDACIPRIVRPVVAVLGAMGARISQAGVRNGLIDGINNPDATLAWSNLVVAHANETIIENVRSVNSGPAVVDPLGGVREGLCLLTQHADNTTIQGGEYAGSGYDTIRIAGRSKGTRLIGVTAKDANRGAVQCTPLSEATTFISCTLDNTEGGTTTSHALFAHNTKDIEFIGGVLLANTGQCMSVFGDGNVDRAFDTDGVRVRGVKAIHTGTVPAFRINSLYVKNVDLDVSITAGAHMLFVQDGVDGLSARFRGKSTGIQSAFYINGGKRFTLDLDTESAATGNAHIALSSCVGGKITGRVKQPSGQSISLITSSKVILSGYTATTSDGVWSLADNSDIDVLDCDFSAVTNANPLRVYASTGRLRGNRKAPTEGSGVATVPAAGTSVTVTHGLWVGSSTTGTPRVERLWTARDFQVSFTGNPGTARSVWISTVTPTQVTFTVDAAPGADVGLVWSARMDRTT